MSRPDRKLSEFAADDDRDDRPDRLEPEPEPEPQPDDDGDECHECGSPSVAYSDPSAVHDGLPAEPLCRKCILEII